jgi:hypothetical protein
MACFGEIATWRRDIKQEFDQYLKSADKMPSNLIRVVVGPSQDPA